MQRDGALTSLWQSNMPAYPSPATPIPQEIVDILIVGGGITGITTALLLQKAGKKCIVAEANTLCFGTTGGTTAHLNTVLDHPYNEIKSKFGEKAAQTVAEAAKEALDLIRKNVAEYKIDCEFEEQDGYMFSQDEKQTKELISILEATNNAGITMQYIDSIPVPIEFEKAVMFPGQAKFHPAKYVYGLAKAFEQAGGIILQGCRVTKVEENDNIEALTRYGKIRAKEMIWATHIPPGVNLLHFRCAPYRSYAMAVKLQDENYPEGLAYDMYDPYHYYRTQVVDGEKYLIAGGEDHKTAHEENTNMCFDKLESYLKKHFKISEVSYRWSSQYFEPTDGLAYIGHLPGHPEKVYVATGFGGNGMTFGTISAITLSDMIAKGSSKYQELFDPNRIKPVAGFEAFVKEAADVVGHMIKSPFAGAKIKELSELAHGEARVVKYEGHRIALYKDDKGKVFAVNPTCPHAKCSVAWNMAEKSWDCPCHGSRFAADGKMLSGPSMSDLQHVHLEEVERVKE
ncbi:MAG TPA: FAD-dependent oxidoreductase [Chitinophagaceae bacterium]|nr:FAD-dependent oxidoreductase [Chitinophagaceae bacterium]